ncbi:MAG: DJ-1/PfpI family protein [Eubacteriales bacterium]|nr:DJ-1/PfpI family protein [Eubacteriales bacterium]
MAKVYAFLANGSEEVECLAVVDVLRRAGIDTVLVSINEGCEVTGSHGIRIVCDTTIADACLSDAEVLFLPGGMPGTTHLMECEVLTDALRRHYKAGKRVAAICAAPSVLGALGFLKGRKATCFPGFEEKLSGAEYSHTGVVTDGNVTTARGLGYALDLGLELVGLLCSETESAALKQTIQYDQI